MDNSKSLLTVNYKLDAAKNFISSIEDNQYYFFVGNHVDANNDVRPFNNEQDILISSYHGMIFGKKLYNNDVSLMIRRVDWEANTIYDIYDHRDDSLYDKNFYVVINEGNQWDVFKCLENGNGNPSTVPPSRTNVSATGENFYYPTDGYRWKYMYSVSDADKDKFATSEYFPVETDATTKSQAKAGSIDAIEVVTPGRGYSNYISGSFAVSDIKLNGDPKKYGISTPGVKTTNGYYDGCWLYISSGAGSGQYRMIETYTSNATHNFVTLTSEFDPADYPQNGSEFDISPSVEIKGDGRETISATARAIIDSNGNTVSRIEMIEPGKNYYHASAEVWASGAVGVAALSGVVPILSPYNGHGYDAPGELGGRYVGIGAKLVGTEANTIITDNDYSQIGILKDPLFNTVQITLKNENRDFYTNEVVYKIETQQLAGTVETGLDANSQLTDILTVTGANAYSIVDIGSTVLVNEADNYQLANVVAISNTTIQLDQTALWNTDGNTANIHLATIVGSGLVDAFSAGSVTLTNATSNFQSDDIIIGSETGTYAQANVVTINGETKTFDTFMQTYAYVGTMTQGNFIADEIIYQSDNPNANARFHSIVTHTPTSSYKIHVTNQMGIFNTSADGGAETDEIKGLTSGGIATLTNKYLPDLVYGSGDIVYIEYGESITRAAEKTETFKLVFAF